MIYFFYFSLNDVFFGVCNPGDIKWWCWVVKTHTSHNYDLLSHAYETITPNYEMTGVTTYYVTFQLYAFHHIA